MTSKPISRRAALRSIGQGAAIAAGAVAIPGSGLAAMTTTLASLPAKPDGRIWQEHLGDFDTTPIWLGELDGKLTVGWLDIFKGKRYGNYVQLTDDLNGRPLRKVWGEVEHGESFIRVLQINHQQTMKPTNALHDPSPDESNLVSWKRHQKYLAEPVKPQANNLG